MTRYCWIACLLFSLFSRSSRAQSTELSRCDVIWRRPSQNAGGSMPCGGGNTGLNVWVEQGDLYFYMAQSGSFDENNALLKSGRVRVRLSPNPLAGTGFRQELVLADGYIRIDGTHGKLKATIDIWVDVFRPVVHITIRGNRPMKAEADYESWRYRDRVLHGRENNGNSYKWAPPGEVKTYKDEIGFQNDGVLFYHRNRPDPSVFDLTVQEQGLDSVKNQLFDPIKNRCFGGWMEGAGLYPAGTYTGRYLKTDYCGWRLRSRSRRRSRNITVYLHTEQTPTLAGWQSGLQQVIRDARSQTATAWPQTRRWWRQFWERSFIFIQPDGAGGNSPEWQAGRNYQLFRYMLACNAFGDYPTKFNGGLFTYDPVLTDTADPFTPDFRNWGGGTFTAQNQRLLYYPMLKSGDFDMMKPAFDFYLRLLRTAELRSEVYWGHPGACFTEQLENFGLPNGSEYGWKRPEDFDKGLQYNAWLEYEWDAVLEFCHMMLQTERYTGRDISAYIPFVESCLRFFDEHYQYLARKRGRKTFDADGHLVLYPGSACETYKMAYDASSTIAALQTVLTELLALPGHDLTTDERHAWTTMLQRIPPLSFRECRGHPCIAPARLWARINNTESPQLYPVFPWGLYGVGKPALDTALNTWKYDTDVARFRSYKGWKQDNIFAARLGLTQEAARLTILKMQNSGRRFPAFWGPGFDWTPDHNWGGSGMIGLQEMLLQTDGKKIILFPAWPRNWDVHFKLHAPFQTTVEATVKHGKLTNLTVLPESRRKDVVNMF